MCARCCSAGLYVCIIFRSCKESNRCVELTAMKHKFSIKFSDRLRRNLKLKEIFCKSHNPWSADCLKILLSLHLRRWKQSHDVLFLPTESNNLSSSFQAKLFQWNADWINCFSICMIGPKIIFAQRLWTNKKLPSFNFFHPGIYWWKLFQMPLIIYN